MVNNSRYVKRPYYGIMLLLILPTLAYAEKREWTMEDGGKLFCECVDFDGKLMIKKQDGAKYVFSARFERFSDQDQAYLREHYHHIFDRNEKYAASHGTKPNAAGLFDPPPMHQLGVSQASGWDQAEYLLPQFRPLTVNGIPTIGDIESAINRNEYFRDVAKTQMETLLKYYSDRDTFLPLAKKFRERGLEGTLRSGDDQQQRDTSENYKVFGALFHLFHLKKHKEALAKIRTETTNDFELGKQAAQIIEMYDEHLQQFDTPEELHLTILENVRLDNYDFDRKRFPLRLGQREIMVRGSGRHELALNIDPLNPWEKPQAFDIDVARAREISGQLDGNPAVLKFDFILSDFRRAALDNSREAGNEPTVSAELVGVSLVYAKDPHTEVYRWKVQDLEVDR